MKKTLFGLSILVVLLLLGAFLTKPSLNACVSKIEANGGFSSGLLICSKCYGGGHLDVQSVCTQDHFLWKEYYAKAKKRYYIVNVNTGEDLSEVVEEINKGNVDLIKKHPEGYFKEVEEFEIKKIGYGAFGKVNLSIGSFIAGHGVEDETVKSDYDECSDYPKKKEK